MQFIILILFICFFIGLFCIFLLSKDDFILLRRNISLEQVFNYAFISFAIGILSARIVYVLFHPSIRYLNPLIFFIFPYFPGLSLTGGVIGVMIYIFALSKKKKIPRGRLFDIFSLSFLLCLPIGIGIFDFILSILKKKILMVDFFLIIGYLIAFIVLTTLFVKGKITDDTMGFATIIVFCLFTLISHIFIQQDRFFLFFGKEDIVLFLLLMVTVLGLLSQAKFSRKKR